MTIEPYAVAFERNNPELKAVVDAELRRLIQTRELHRLYDKWFTQPIPPNNVNLNMPASEGTKAAWANPNDKPMEDYGNK